MSREPSSDEIHRLIRASPDVAWPLVVAFIHANPGSAAAGAFIEDFVYEHDERFIDRLEGAALADPVFRSVAEQAYVGGDASIGAERFHALQRRLEARRDR